MLCVKVLQQRSDKRDESDKHCNKRARTLEVSIMVMLLSDVVATNHLFHTSKHRQSDLGQ